MGHLNKIKDFVHSFQLENLQQEIAKGTQVSFLLPKNLQYEVEGTTVEVGLGMIQEREEGVYTILYKDESLEVKAEDILATKQQLEKIKLLDSVIATNKVVWGNVNDLLNMKNRLIPDVSEDEMSAIETNIKDAGIVEGDTVVFFTTDTTEQEEITGIILTMKLDSGEIINAKKQ